jgi:hypothetical protein
MAFHGSLLYLPLRHGTPGWMRRKATKLPTNTQRGYDPPGVAPDVVYSKLFDQLQCVVTVYTSFAWPCQNICCGTVYLVHFLHLFRQLIVIALVITDRISHNILVLSYLRLRRAIYRFGVTPEVV